MTWEEKLAEVEYSLMFGREASGFNKGKSTMQSIFKYDIIKDVKEQSV